MGKDALSWVIGCVLGLVVLASPTVKAGEDSSQSPPDQPRRTGLAQFVDPADQQLDLSYFLQTPHGFIPVPIVVTEPAVGYGGGAAGMFIKPRKDAGQEGFARPNLTMVAGLATENGTWAGFAGNSSRWMDERLRTLAGLGTGRINLDFYGAGLGLPDLNEPVSYSLDFTGAIMQANWQLAPKSPWAAGLRYVYAKVDPEARDSQLLPGTGVALDVTVSAPTAVIEFDTRDNIFTPGRGIYAETSYLASLEALGASQDFQRFEQVLIGFISLPHAITLGSRLNYAWSSQDTPFFLRPYISLRGVPAMRYQGYEVATLELEGRWQFKGRWSLVTFGGFGATRIHENVSADGQSVGSGGVGFRYQLASRFGIHAGLDVAHSPGTTAVYIQLGSAWFRP